MSDVNAVNSATDYSPEPNPFGPRENRIPRDDAKRAEQRRVGSLEQKKMDKYMIATLDKPAQAVTTQITQIERNNVTSTGVACWKLWAGSKGAFPMEFPIDDAVLIAAVANLASADQDRLALPKHPVKATWQIKWQNNGRFPLALTITASTDWRDDPDAVRNLASDTNAGENFIRLILGTDATQWDAVRANAVRTVREAQEKAVKDSDGQPIAASVKPNWSAAVKAAEMANAPVAADPKQHVMEPDKMTFAVPNHIQRELSLDKLTIGKHIIACFGLSSKFSLAAYIEKHGPAATWATAEAYVAAQRVTPVANPIPPSVGDANAEPPDDSDDLGDWFPESTAAQAERSAPKTNGEAAPLPVTAPAPVSVTTMTEAAFVLLLNLYSREGIEMRFTLRAMSAQELSDRIDDLIKVFSKRGYTTQRAAQSNSAPPPANAPILPPPAGAAGAVPPPQPAANGGTERCAEVKRVMDEGKVKYHFFRHAGDANPCLKINNGEIGKKILGGVIGVDQMVPGNRYPLALDVDWKNSENVGQNGSPFRNVTAVRVVA